MPREGCRSFTRRSIRHALGSMAMYGSGVPADGTIGVGADDLVSGEAVALDLPPANIRLRVLSGLIDIVAGMSLWFALRYIRTALAGDTDDAMLIATLTVATILAIVAFPTAIENRDPRQDARPSGAGAAHRPRRRRSDQLSARADPGSGRQRGTVQLHGFSGASRQCGEQKGQTARGSAGRNICDPGPVQLRMPQPVPMPGYLEPWARSADIATLPPQLTLAIRQYFARRLKLTPSSRAIVLDRLVVETSRYVAPLPPPGTPGEYLLAAVLAERRRRDTVRIGRENRLRQRLLS